MAQATEIQKIVDMYAFASDEPDGAVAFDEEVMHKRTRGLHWLSAAEVHSGSMVVMDRWKGVILEALLVGDREVQQGRLRGRPAPVEAGTPRREERSVSEPHHSEDEIGATGFAAIGLGMAVVGMVAARWAGGK